VIYLFSSLAVYLNPIEHEMLGPVERAATMGNGVVAIRPLAAGKATAAGIDARTCLRDVLCRPSVCTAVVTYSSVEHMEELVRAALAITDSSEPQPAPPP